MQYLKPNVKYLKRDVDDYFRNWKSDEWHHALIVINLWRKTHMLACGMKATFLGLT